MPRAAARSGRDDHTSEGWDLRLFRPVAGQPRVTACTPRRSSVSSAWTGRATVCNTSTPRPDASCSMRKPSGLVSGASTGSAAPLDPRRDRRRWRIEEPLHLKDCQRRHPAHPHRRRARPQRPFRVRQASRQARRTPRPRRRRVRQMLLTLQLMAAAGWLRRRRDHATTRHPSFTATAAGIGPTPGRPRTEK